MGGTRDSHGLCDQDMGRGDAANSMGGGSDSQGLYNFRDCEHGLCDQGMGRLGCRLGVRNGAADSKQDLGEGDAEPNTNRDALLAGGQDDCVPGLHDGQDSRLGMRTGAADSNQGLGEGEDANPNTSRDTQSATLSPTTNGAVVRYVGIPLGTISVPVLTIYTPGIDQDRDQADADDASGDRCTREITSGHGQCEDQSMGSGYGHGQSDGRGVSREDAGHNLCDCEGLCDGQGMGGGDAEEHSMGSDDDQGMSRGDATSWHDLCEGCAQGLCVDQGCRLGMRTGAADSKQGLGEGESADHNTSRDTQPDTLSPTINGAVVRYVGIPLGNISVPVLMNYTPGIIDELYSRD